MAIVHIISNGFFFLCQVEFKNKTNESPNFDLQLKVSVHKMFNFNFLYTTQILYWYKLPRVLALLLTYILLSSELTTNFFAVVLLHWEKGFFGNLPLRCLYMLPIRLDGSRLYTAKY